MPDHWSKAQIASTLLVVAFGFTLAITGCYIWLLPKLFNGYKTYSVLVLGLLGSYVSGGYIAFKHSGVPSHAMRGFVTICCGLLVASVVLYFSMLIILNVMGS